MRTLCPGEPELQSAAAPSAKVRLERGVVRSPYPPNRTLCEQNRLDADAQEMIAGTMKGHLTSSSCFSAASRNESPATKSETNPSRRAGEPENNGSLDLNTILVPVDFSPGALHALNFAVSLAGRIGASIVLVHVMDPIYVPGRLDSPRLRSLQMEAHEDTRRLLAGLAKRRVRPHVPVRHYLLKGTPSAKIVEAASRTGADLVVMGSEGRSGIKRFLVGSVAERVIRHARCPVLVVRDRVHRGSS
jgi:nucleotide-binding universal stress UspA family protein